MGALEVVVSSSGPLLFLLAGVTSVFSMYVGLAVCVALFHHDSRRRDAAFRVLDRLLATIRPKRR